jgi:hypothetical protein
LYCSHPAGLEKEDEGKWAGGDPPVPLCGGYGRGFQFIYTSSDVGRYVEPIK